MLSHRFISMSTCVFTKTNPSTEYLAKYFSGHLSSLWFPCLSIYLKNSAVPSAPIPGRSFPHNYSPWFHQLQTHQQSAAAGSSPRGCSKTSWNRHPGPHEKVTYTVSILWSMLCWWIKYLSISTTIIWDSPLCSQQVGQLRWAYS